MIYSALLSVSNSDADFTKMSDLNELRSQLSNMPQMKNGIEQSVIDRFIDSEQWILAHSVLTKLSFHCNPEKQTLIETEYDRLTKAPKPNSDERKEAGHIPQRRHSLNEAIQSTIEEKESPV